MSCVCCGSQRNPPFNIYCADCYLAFNAHVRLYGETLRKYLKTKYNVKIPRFKRKKTYYDYYRYCKKFHDLKDLPDYIVLREQMLYNKVSEEKIKQQAAVLWNYPKLCNELNMLNFAAQSCSESLKHEAEITIKQLYRKYSLF